MENRTEIRNSLFKKLSDVAKKGPIPAIGQGDQAVGMTLLHALGIEYSSSTKPNYFGIVVTAHRRPITGRGNRVNLFAQVPNWLLSNCKSSREIVELYGYDLSPNKRQLYCTVNSRHLNSQGLILEIDREQDYLLEIAKGAGKHSYIATWQINKLKERLVETHPETIWVKAVTFERNGQEFFHYRECVYSGAPKENEFTELLETGTITLDHLISLNNGKVIEKGPLFKIRPTNLELLFPNPIKYDLMSLD